MNDMILQMDSEGRVRELCILVVEDHEPSRVVLRTLLERRKYRVLTASDLQEAFFHASRNEISLVISDIGLPDGTGYELMPVLIQEYGLRGISTSGYSSDLVQEQSQAAGFLFHLRKPINIRDLDSILSDLLSR